MGYSTFTPHPRVNSLINLAIVSLLEIGYSRFEIQISNLKLLFRFEIQQAIRYSILDFRFKKQLDIQTVFFGAGECFGAEECQHIHPCSMSLSPVSFGA